MNEFIYLDIVRKDNGLDHEISVRVTREGGALIATVVNSVPDPQSRRDRHEWLWERGEIIPLTEEELTRAYGRLRIKREL